MEVITQLENIQKLMLNYSRASVNPHTTQKNNSHFRLHWGPMNPIFVVKRSLKQLPDISLPGQFLFGMLSVVHWTLQGSLRVKDHLGFVTRVTWNSL